jgi:poly(A) polymerase
MTESKNQEKIDVGLVPIEQLENLITGHPQILLDLAVDNPPIWNELPENYRKLLLGGAKSLEGYENLLKEKLDIILMNDDPGKSLQWLEDTGVLEILLPEVHDTVHLSGEEERRHKHVWGHTKQVVSQTPKKLVLRYAALFHDIGKVKTRNFEENGKVTFYAHDIVGAGMFRSIAKRLNLEKKFAKHIYNLIKLHLRPGQYQENWNDSAVRRLGKEVGDQLIEDLLNLGRADITSKRPQKVTAAKNRIDTLEKRLKEIIELDAQIPPLPKGLGNIIMKEKCIKPGPQLGKLMKWLKNEVEIGKLQPQKDNQYYMEALESCPLL